MDAPNISLIFVAVVVLMSVPMTVSVGLRRAATGVQLLHGDDEELLKRIRAHGNFTEYAPLALIALVGAELSQAPAWLIVACGSLLVLARVVHYATLRGSVTGIGRPMGTLLTVVILTVLSATILAGTFGVF